MKFSPEILIPVAFPIFWCFTCWMISRVGGWYQWAEAYPNRAGHLGKVLWMQAGSFSLGRYNGTINLSADPDALALSVLFPFRFGHQPIRIPWDELSVTLKKSRWFGNLVDVSAKKVPGVSLQLAETTWKKLQKTGGRAVPLPEDTAEKL